MTSVSTLLERFSNAAPIAVMARASMVRLFSDDLLNQVFEEHAPRQYTKELAFSSAEEKEDQSMRI